MQRPRRDDGPSYSNRQSKQHQDAASHDVDSQTRRLLEQRQQELEAERGDRLDAHSVGASAGEKQQKEQLQRVELHGRQQEEQQDGRRNRRGQEEEEGDGMWRGFAFEEYRWQPDGCDLPPFNASDFLTRFRHRTIAFVGDSLSRQQFLSLLCLLAPHPHVLTWEQAQGIDPANEVNPGNAAQQGVQVQVVNVDFRFNLTWGPAVLGIARGAAIWLPGSNTTIIQRTSNLLCREELLPTDVEVEGEEGEEGGEGGGEGGGDGGGDGGGKGGGKERNKAGEKEGESEEEGNGRRGKGQQLGEGGAGRQRRFYRRVVHVYEADEWLTHNLLRLDVVVLSTVNHWSAQSFIANQFAVKSSPAARPFMPSEGQLKSTAFLADLRRQALVSVMRSLARTVAESAAATAESATPATESARVPLPVIFLRSASPVHFTGGTFQTGGRCDMYEEPLSPATACPHAAECRDAAAEEAVAAASTAVLSATDIAATTGPVTPPSATSVPTSASPEPMVPWLRLLDVFPLSKMRADAHVVGFFQVKNAPALPHPLLSRPVLSQMQMLPPVESRSGESHLQGSEEQASPLAESKPHRRRRLEAGRPQVPGNGSSKGVGLAEAPTQESPDALVGAAAPAMAHSGGVIGDCVHWCLPGVPDTWNELLYSEMVQSGLFTSS
ncbi:hypothetical protein CLOM_g16686 [Closterium sp. NIES-68]|nr:hypothetical protein CLOM_g16686 [Closterium sp. NIES-68]